LQTSWLWGGGNRNSDFAKLEANHEINVRVDDSLVSNRFDRYKN